MASSVFETLDTKLGYVAASALFLLFAAGLWSTKQAWYLASRYPLLGGEYGGADKRGKAYLSHAAALFDQGYRQFKTAIYRLTTPDGDHLIVPNCYLDELRRRPDNELDVLKAFEKTFENNHVRLFPSKDKTTIINNVVKVDLTRNLGRINPRLSDEVARTVASELAGCDGAEWTPVVLSGVLLRIVAIVSGNIFLGPELCREAEYMHCAVQFTVDLVAASAALKRWPAWLRSVAAATPLVPQVARVHEHRRRMKAFLRPVIEQRRMDIEGRRKADDADAVPPPADDLFQWLMEKSAASGVTDAGDLTDMLLLILLAAIHTTSLAVTNLFYDLAIRPEVVEELRAEIKSVLADSGGVMTTQALYDMKLVDSVMRESQRLNPPFIDAFRRYAMQPITLQNGDRIPKGTYIETANTAVLRDPSLYPSPDDFNPHRFSALREPDVPDPLGYKNREQYQYVSVTKENMSFGFGRHACPGRYFAANEIKMILAQLLLHYDIRMPDGESERYQSVWSGVVIAPDPTKALLFRRVAA
ncbi:ent-kaurene oxidase [Lasiosphaeria ovina]|uniref:Ent-kaurene oxidase n=1 Tax=Lasiosphaeria ovina TaxID=92902 RepID=A0AAE0N4A8_9PEZI|nr:ent-kaurene oxidase [Lasiosphaeria ovina]